VKLRIGVVAPSAPIGKIESERGFARLKSQGWDVRVHPQVRRKHVFFAGTDEQRASALIEYAYDPSLDVLWCARGGYGAYRLLSALDREIQRRGVPPRKLLVGYSDATLLLDYASRRWKWPVLHAPMAGTGEFSQIAPGPWRQICRQVENGGQASLEYRVKWLGRAPRSAIRAPLVGGNLAVWSSLVGTPHKSSANGKILFLEEITEAPYRMDRLLRQLEAAGGLNGVKAMVLGTFTDCEDSVMKVLADRSEKPAYKPLRPRVSHSRALREIFGEAGERHGFAVGYGLPIGHGGGHWPLPLGPVYRISPDGKLRLEVGTT